MLDHTKETVYDERPLSEQTMNSILENRAEELGERPFIRYGPEEREVSFAEMNRVANAIGRSLTQLGVGSGDKVSLMMRNPLETLFAMFGIHKAGGVYSPINFEYKGQTLKYQLNDTSPEVLFLEDRYINRLNEIVSDLHTDPHVVTRETAHGAENLDNSFQSSVFAGMREPVSDGPDIALSPHDEASVVYTSGTTGKPKGVVLPHRWIFANYVSFGQELMNEDDVVHTSLPLYHVGGVYADVVAALVSGSQVSLWDRFSASEFWDRIDRYQATRVHLLSVMMPRLMDPPETSEDHHNTLDKVHMQPLPDNYDDIAERFGFDIVTAGFGQTESGAPISGVIDAVSGENATPKELQRGVSAEEVKERARELEIPVVKGVPEERWMGMPRSKIVDVAILDDNNEPVEQGGVGELAIRPNASSLLMREYYGKPEKTVEAFRDLWFHTGDAVYEDEDGHLYFVDRIGDVIRRHGENISSFQVQDMLNTHPAVQEAAAFPIKAERGGEDLGGGAVEVSDDANISASDIKDFLREEMPDFMIPDELYLVDDIPTTETNKIEKRELRSQVTSDD